MVDFLCTLTGSCVRFRTYDRLSMCAYMSGGNKAYQKCEAGAYKSLADNTINLCLNVRSLVMFLLFYNKKRRNNSNLAEFCCWEEL